MKGSHSARKFALIIGLGLLVAAQVTAQPFTTLYNFSQAPGDINTDGTQPLRGGLVLAGNRLYGTADGGGPFGDGTIFAINSDGTGFTTLYSFTNGNDGAFPAGRLLLVGDTLYGTAMEGGSFGLGTIFAINTNGTGFRTVYTFTGGTDSAFPCSGVILAGNTFYGAAGGAGPGDVEVDGGAVFSVNTNGSGFTTLHSFTGVNDVGGDGAFPYDRLVLSGNVLYGTTCNGGILYDNGVGQGTVFAINTDGTGYTILHKFGGFYGSDGAGPEDGLILVADTLYGTTSSGSSVATNDYGTIFSVNTNGGNYNVLYDFNGPNAGGEAWSALLFSGNMFYGTTVDGVYQINTNGTDFKELHFFNVTYPGGFNLLAGLVLSNNTLYGTTQYGGTAGNGTVFSLWIGATTQFTAAPNAGPPPLSVQFNSPGVDGSGNSIVSWRWNFGDGATSALQNPVHVYTNSGVFTPALVATNLNGSPLVDTGPAVIVANNPNIVQNGGFETGNLDYWTDFEFGQVMIDDGTSGISPHSGTFLADLWGGPDILYQTLSTTAGTKYTLSFWFNNTFADPNQFQVSWNGQTLLNVTNLVAPDWTNFQFLVTASGASTLLQFGFQDDSAFLGLDDVSVVPIIASGSPTIASAARVSSNQFQMLLHGLANQNYTLQMSTNVASTNWVTLYFTNNPATNSFLLTDSNATNAQRFYRILVGP